MIRLTTAISSTMLNVLSHFWLDMAFLLLLLPRVVGEHYAVEQKLRQWTTRAAAHEEKENRSHFHFMISSSFISIHLPLLVVIRTWVYVFSYGINTEHAANKGISWGKIINGKFNQKRFTNFPKISMLARGAKISRENYSADSHTDTKGEMMLIIISIHRWWWW